MYKKGRVNSNSRIISTDEDPSLRIESSAIINLRGVSTKLNKYMFVKLSQKITIYLHGPSYSKELQITFVQYMDRGSYLSLANLSLDIRVHSPCYSNCLYETAYPQQIFRKTHAKI